MVEGKGEYVSMCVGTHPFFVGFDSGSKAY